MTTRIIRLRPYEKHQVRRGIRKAPTEDARRRCRVLLALHRGLDAGAIIVAHDVGLRTVYRVRELYLAAGLPALVDRRTHRPAPKSQPEVLDTIEALVGAHPQDLGLGRSRWTCELLALPLYQKLRIAMHRSWVHVLLRRLRARWGRPRPSVRRLNPLRWAQWAPLARRLRRVGPGEVILNADEVDIDLNPRIGFAWMRWGEQLEVPTPGQNEKRYLAGALNPDTGHLIWVEGKRKTSDLFLALVAAISGAYRWARRIHLVVDNFIIHFSKKTTREVARYDGRIKIHGLPTYSPQLNPIERLWKQLHDAVTRNHRFPTMTRLLAAVHRFLRESVPFRTGNPIHLRLAA